jgi:LAO/AO transport system kinase
MIPVSFLMPSDAQKVAMRERILTCEPGFGLRMTEKLSADRVVARPCITVPSGAPSEEAISSARARGSSRVFLLTHPIDDNRSAGSSAGRYNGTRFNSRPGVEPAGDEMTDPLAGRVLKGDRRAVARAITRVENGEDSTDLLNGIRKSLGRAFILGLTGPPGTGKSTLVDRIIAQYRERKMKVGVIAVDPTSPITGGALLGDRVRMAQHTLDSGVFIRSMASRGWSGGLSGAVSEAIQILDAAGMEVVIIETVGIGQSDIEIMKIAHAVMVVTMPGLGDDVQVSKAGLMEIGDIYAVNKSDLPGADVMVINLLSMVRDMKGRSPPVLKVSALKGEGMDILFNAVETMRGRFLSPAGEEMRLRSVRGMIVELAKKKLLSEFEGTVFAMSVEVARKVADHKMSFEEAAELLRDSQRKY